MIFNNLHFRYIFQFWANSKTGVFDGNNYDNIIHKAKTNNFEANVLKASVEDVTKFMFQSLGEYFYAFRDVRGKFVIQK